VEPRAVVILGSTGSIGTQALDVIRRNPDRFRVAGLAAGGGNPALLAQQAIEFGVTRVAVARPSAGARTAADAAASAGTAAASAATVVLRRRPLRRPRHRPPHRRVRAERRARHARST